MTTCGHGSLFSGKELAAVGTEVSAITLDSDIVIHAGERREHEFRIENEIILENDARNYRLVVRYNPFDRSHPVREKLTELSAIIGTTVFHARAYMDGTLELVLSDGSVLTVMPEERFEAWTYTFGNYILASPPGGFG